MGSMPHSYAESLIGLLLALLPSNTLAMSADTATTNDGTNPSSLVSVSLTFEIDQDNSGKEALTYGNYVASYNPGGIPLPDNDSSTTGTRDAVNLGQGALVFGAPPALGAAKVLLGTFDVTITGGTAANTFLAIIAQGMTDATSDTNPQPLLTSSMQATSTRSKPPCWNDQVQCSIWFGRSVPM